MYFRNYGLQKTWLDICLKTSFSDDPSTSNMVNLLRNCLKDSIFNIFVITLNAIQSEKVSLSNIQNLETVCLHIHFR